MSTLASIDNRVPLGITWLDSVRPNWRESIDLATLDLANSTDCILGQVFWDDAAWTGYFNGFTYVLESGHFKDAAGSSLTPAWLIAHGFEADEEPYAALEQAWRFALSEPKQAGE